MSMRRTYSRVQSFPSPVSDASSPPSNQINQSLAPKLENLHRISADQLSKILDASIVAQKTGLRLALDAVSPATGSSSDWKFINCYLDSTVLLLDACNNIQLRLESIKSCLDSIPMGLHYLESEHEPGRVILQRVAESLNFSCFRDKYCYTKMEKSMSRIRSVGKRLSRHILEYQVINDSISPELYKALTSSWTMAVFAIGVLNSATSFKSLTSPGDQPKAEPWTMKLNEIGGKMKVFPRKSTANATNEELASTYVAAQALLKLISSWQKGDNSSSMRMAVKAVAGELRMRRDKLQQGLALLEENIRELYRQIVALRISMLGLLSKVQKEDVLEMVIMPFSYEESQIDTNAKQYERNPAWVIVKAKTKRSCSAGLFLPYCFGLK